MFAESTENTDEKVSDKLNCESCGKEFSCGANVGKCWCFAVELKAETLAELRENFKSCLCEDCLMKDKDVDFGNFDYQKKFSRKYSSFLKILPDLENTSKSIIENVTSINLEELTILFLFLEVRDDFRSILTLCANGFSRNAAKILRSLFEHAVTMKHLCENPNETYLFLNFYCLNERKRLNRLLKLCHDNEQKETIRKKIAEFETECAHIENDYKVLACKKCNTLKTQHSWTKLDIYSMAEKFGGLDYTGYFAYTEALLESHPSTHSIEARMEVVKGILKNKSQPDEKQEENTLLSAHHLYLFALDAFIEYFNIENTQTKFLDDSFKEAWSFL